MKTKSNAPNNDLRIEALANEYSMLENHGESKTDKFYEAFMKSVEKGYLRPFGLTTSQSVALLLVALSVFLYTHWSREARRA